MRPTKVRRNLSQPKGYFTSKHELLSDKEKHLEKVVFHHLFCQISKK